METIELYTKELKTDAAAVTGQLGGLQAVAVSAAAALKTLDDRMLVLRLNLGKLKAALLRAVAPVLNSVLPAVNTAVRALTALVNDVAKVTAALFGGAEGADAMASAQKTLTTSTKKTVRALADFDTLDRLDTGRGSGTVAVPETVTLPAVKDTLTPELQAIVAKLRSLLEPLQRIDFTPVKAAFEALRQAMAPITRELFAGLEWAWHNLLVPLARWVAEDALPVFLGMLTAALETLGTTIEALKPLGQWLWENLLQPLAAWTGDTIIDAMEWITEKLVNFGTWVEENQGKVQSFIELLEGFASAWDTVSAAVKTAWQWLHPKEDFFSRFGKGSINGVIGLLNGMLRGITTGINHMIRLLNKLSFTVPGWVPGIGGETLGFNLKTLTAPQIPYLAQGAVLPANKPFLAVVGDQKHGTNIEAPLATIQQALADVLAQQGSGDVTINFTGDLAQLGRVLRPVIEKESRRRGSSLAKGAVV